MSAINKAKLATKEALTDVRRSVATLRSSLRDIQPIAPALEKLAEQTNATGINTHLELLGNPRPLSSQAELTLYRAAQEGLTNACKYSKANNINLILDFSLEQKVKLIIKDDGVGASTLTGGFGLLSIKERAQLLGGKIEINTELGKGFILELELEG